MKKIILIEDHHLLQIQYLAIILANLLGRSENELLSPMKLESLQPHRDQLEKEKRITIEVISSVDEIEEKYSQGMPEDAVIIMDGQLHGRKTAEIFHLFSEKAKNMTMPMSAAPESIEYTKSKGFQEGIQKDEFTEQKPRLLDFISEKLNELA